MNSVWLEPAPAKRWQLAGENKDIMLSWFELEVANQNADCCLIDPCAAHEWECERATAEELKQSERQKSEQSD